MDNKSFIDKLREKRATNVQKILERKKAKVKIMEE